MIRTDSGIPSPRLELRWERHQDCEDWARRTCIYSFIIPVSQHDIRCPETGRQEIELEIARTEVSGGGVSPPIQNNSIDTPYRDGAHARWDQKAIGMHIPIIARCENSWCIISQC